ncbi:MAG: aldo/keto reductase [Polyangiaceae bacterium]|nr:aldo/keto reductase [Polyangiaceae bacterium]
MIDERGFDAALDRGLNYIFWTALRTGKLKPALRRALSARREDYVLATGPSFGYFGGNVRRAAERLLSDLGTDYIDVFQLFWLGVSSAWTPGTMEALVRLKEEGKVRAIGTSIHDRVRAGELAKDSPLDLLMLRYNAAHPGAEKDVFPHLSHRNPAVVAYTATSWRKLLKAPPGWDKAPMTAGDCYRFCLSDPHVDLVLMGAANEAELDENLKALGRGPLSPDEAEWMRNFGRVVHG